MKVKFMPQNVTFEIKSGQTVLEVAQQNGIYIKSVCGGLPSCAECRVRMLEGDYNVLPPASAELALIGTAHFVDRRRLSCQMKCFGDVTVDLSEQIKKEQIQKTGKLKVRPGATEDAPSSHAVKGSILEESPLELSAAAQPVSVVQSRPEPPSAPSRHRRGGRNRRKKVT
jgi:2Fe-2S ferredoxin